MDGILFHRRGIFPDRSRCPDFGQEAVDTLLKRMEDYAIASCHCRRLSRKNGSLHREQSWSGEPLHSFSCVFRTYFREELHEIFVYSPGRGLYRPEARRWRHCVSASFETCCSFIPLRERSRSERNLFEEAITDRPYG